MKRHKRKRFDPVLYISNIRMTGCDVVAYRYATGERSLGTGVPVGATPAQHRRYDRATAAYNADPQAGTKVFDACVHLGLVVDIPAAWPADATDPK